jgi:hypothetical protein
MRAVVVQRSGSIKGLLVYVGIGAICHLLFAGVHLDPSSVWTWIWLFAWPVMLLFKAVYWAILVTVVVMAVAWLVLR